MSGTIDHEYKCRVKHKNIQIFIICINYTKITSMLQYNINSSIGIQKVIGVHYIVHINAIMEEAYLEAI